jgi:hypothetical protein
VLQAQILWSLHFWADFRSAGRTLIKDGIIKNSNDEKMLRHWLHSLSTILGSQSTTPMEFFAVKPSIAQPFCQLRRYLDFCKW